MANKQTAVDFLYEFVLLKLSNEEQMQFEGLFQQAKKMQEEQIEEAFNSSSYFIDGKEYYNETYGN
jgi:cobalamin biosynthesis Co2+ chelatase CbiK